MSLAGGLAFAIHRFKLDPIVSEIKLLFYHLPSQVSAYAWPQDHASAQSAIQRRLGDWRHGLSTLANTLQSDTAEDNMEYRKYELKLTSQYFAAMVLLYQPSQTMPHPSEQSLLICYQCAASRLNAYNDLYYAESFYQSWRSVQGIFSSGATMIYCLWTSALVRKSISTSEAMKDLRTCTNLLSVGGEWWPSVKKGKESFARAMDALLKTLDSSQARSHPSTTQDGQPRAQRSLHSFQTQVDSSAVDFVTNTDEEMMARDLNYQLQTPVVDTTEFPHMSSNFVATDWTILDDPAFHHDPQSILGTFPDPSTNSTVESFIAEFLQNDTAWNPF